MRQILESIETAQTITESYEQRVQAVASIINTEHPDGITKKEFTAAVEKAGAEAGAVEMRPGKPGLNQKPGNARKDFIKDVAQQVEFRRDNSANDAKKRRTELVLERLSNVIDEAIGNAFPDGDPFDIIYPAAIKMGIRPYDVLEWLDRAVRKHNGGKDYHSYLNNIWQDHMETIHPDGHHNKDAWGSR